MKLINKNLKEENQKYIEGDIIKKKKKLKI